MKPLDLEALRRSIEAAPADGQVGLPTTRRWLEQVELEIRAGRAAQAELARHQGMATAISTIAGGAQA